MSSENLGKKWSEGDLMISRQFANAPHESADATPEWNTRWLGREWWLCAQLSWLKLAFGRSPRHTRVQSRSVSWWSFCDRIRESLFRDLELAFPWQPQWLDQSVRTEGHVCWHVCFFSCDLQKRFGSWMKWKRERVVEAASPCEPLGEFRLPIFDSHLFWHRKR
jgi:hypothetical protein